MSELRRARFKQGDLMLAVSTHHRCPGCLTDLHTMPTHRSPVCEPCDRLMVPVNSGKPCTVPGRAVQ